MNDFVRYPPNANEGAGRSIYGQPQHLRRERTRVRAPG